MVIADRTTRQEQREVTKPATEGEMAFGKAGDGNGATTRADVAEQVDTAAQACADGNATAPADADVCTERHTHSDAIEAARRGMSPSDQIEGTAELFKALADPTRLRVVNALLLAEICVCDLAELLEMSQPAVSHHLKTLRQARLVKTRRDGKTVYYRLDDEHVANLFYQGLLHASHG